MATTYLGSAGGNAGAAVGEVVMAVGNERRGRRGSRATRLLVSVAAGIGGAAAVMLVGSQPAQANYPGPPPDAPADTVAPLGLYEDAPAACPTTAPAGTIPGGTNVKDLCEKAVRQAPTAKAGAALRYAFSMLGARYSQSNRSSINPPVFDCSSFVARAYDAADAFIYKNGTTKRWYRPDYTFSWTGAYMPAAYTGSNLQRLGGATTLQPGDVLVQFNGSDPAGSAGNAGHAQMYIGDGLVIQSGGSHPASLVNVAARGNYLSNEWLFRYGSTAAEEPIFTKWTALGGAAGLAGSPLGAQEDGAGDSTLRRYQKAWIFFSPGTGAREVHGGILLRYLQTGREAGPLGMPTSDEMAGKVAGSRVNTFTGGAIYWAASTGVNEVFGEIGKRYLGLGADGSALGLPTASEEAGPFPGTRQQRFTGGSILFSPGTGAHPISGPIEARYRQSGVAAAIGLPTSAARSAAASGAVVQDFQRGTVYWSAATGADEVYGAILARYRAIGAESSVLGLPVTGELPGGTPGSRKQEFQNGTIHFSPNTGAYEVVKPVKTRYDALGGGASVLGFPVDRAKTVPGATVQVFENGAIYVLSDGRAFEVRGGMWNSYLGLGAQGSPLGLPVSVERAGAVSGTRVQDFQFGTMYWSAATGAREVYGAIRQAYQGMSAEKSALGLPTSGEVNGPLPGTRMNTFSKGAIIWSPQTGARVLLGDMATRYLSPGVAATIGLPSAAERAGGVSGTKVQTFQFGTMYWSAATGAREVFGAILARYQAMGAEKSAAGLPTSVEQAATLPGARVTRFQKGAIYWSATTGAHEVLGTINARYDTLAGPASSLRLPTGPAQVVTGGMMQPFTGGAVYLVAGKANEVTGDIWARYRTIGAQGSVLGLPTSVPRTSAAPGVTVQDFAGGLMYGGTGTGTHEVYGEIVTRYKAMGAERSPLGLPTSGEVAGPLPGSRLTRFAGGVIVWSPATGARDLYGAIGGLYLSKGLASQLGLPTGSERAGTVAGVRVQDFQRGTIYWSAASGPAEIYGAIRDRYRALGAEKSTLGLPTTGEYATSTGRANDFQKGRISWNSRTGAITVTTS